MTTNQILCFVTLADTLNFTAAAEKLYMAQPTFSRVIVSLENELRLQLFDRSRQQVQLTEAGRRFLPYAERLHNSFQEIRTLAEDLNSGLLGRLRIGLSGYSYLPFFSSLINDFKTDNRNVRIDFLDGTEQEMLVHLQNGTIDLCFASSRLARALPNIDYVETVHCPLCVVVGRSHPLANYQGPVPGSRLRQEHILVTSPTAVQHSPLYDFGITDAECIGSMTRIMTLIKCGYGIAVLHQNVRDIYRQDNDICYLPLEDNVNYTGMALWLKDNINPCVPLFTKHLTQFIKNFPLDRPPCV